MARQMKIERMPARRVQMMSIRLHTWPSLTRNLIGVLKYDSTVSMCTYNICVKNVPRILGHLESMCWLKDRIIYQWGSNMADEDKRLVWTGRESLTADNIRENI